MAKSIRIPLAGLALTTLALAAAAQPSNAQAAQTRDYHIESQPLPAAVNDWADQAGLQVMWSARMPGAQREAPEVAGRFSAPVALEQVLAGSGLTFAFLDERTVSIRLAAAATPSPSSGAGKGEDQVRTRSAEGAVQPSPSQGEGRSEDSRHSVRGADSAAASKAETISEVVVTGTHIRGTNPTSPVIVLDRAYIERSGKSTVADVIRTLPQNFNGGGNVGSIGTGSANLNGTDASRINLRGLGTGATLVLVNGHRLAFNGTTGGPDISGIPLSAVERIDVLTDGASAIYGTDAIAGVVNIKLLQSYDGAETTVHLGDTTDGGGFQQRYSQLLGTNWSSGGALLNVEFAKDELIDRSQRDFARNLSNDDYSLQPNLERRSAFASVSQSLSAKITAHVDAMYSDRQSDSIRSRPSAFHISNAYEAEQYLITAGLNFGLSDTWDLSLTLQDGEDETLTGGRVKSPPSAPARPLSSPLVINNVRSGEAILSGKLFDLPAGPLQVAAGGGRRDFSLDNDGTEFTRSSTFGFSEARVPLLGGRSASSSLPVLEGVIAARYEKFDDFGSTFDPKLGLAWRATDEATLRASWGTSFRAPELVQQHGPTSVDLRSLSTPQGGKSTFILVATANPALTAETSKAWNVSVLYEPQWAHNLQLTLSAFQIKYEDRIATPFDPFTVAIADQQTYAQYFVFDPSQAQQDAAIAQGIGPLTNFSDQAYDPNNVAFILDSRLKNLSRVRARGIDIQLDYNVGLQSGDLTTFLNASFVEQKQKASPFVPTVETTDTVFNPPRYRARGGATWAVGELAATAVLNFVGSYDNNLSVVQGRVDSWLTLDAQVGYRPTWAGLWSGLHMNLSVQNVLNSAPPDVAPGTFISVGDVGFDTTNASAVGRMISIGLRKAW